MDTHTRARQWDTHTHMYRHTHTHVQHTHLIARCKSQTYRRMCEAVTVRAYLQNQMSTCCVSLHWPRCVYSVFRLKHRNHLFSVWRGLCLFSLPQTRLEDVPMSRNIQWFHAYKQSYQSQTVVAVVERNCLMLGLFSTQDFHSGIWWVRFCRISLIVEPYFLLF